MYINFNENCFKVVLISLEYKYQFEHFVVNYVCRFLTIGISRFGHVDVSANESIWGCVNVRMIEVDHIIIFIESLKLLVFLFRHFWCANNNSGFLSSSHYFVGILLSHPSFSCCSCKMSVFAFEWLFSTFWVMVW